jgi:hypothetical protein
LNILEKLANWNSMALEDFPEPLRRLVQAELAAGNQIREIGAGFPAPPVGERLMLERAVSTPLPEGIESIERNSSIYQTEFFDQDRRYFVVNPPLPPPPEPNMDEIRERANRPSAPPAPDPSTARLMSGLTMTYDRWHDGESYDLETVTSASPQEQLEMERMIRARGITVWQDVEALAAIGTPGALEALRQALENRDRSIRLAVLTHAPQLVSEWAKTQVLLDAIAHGEIYGGLTQALLIIEDFHPPEIEAALKEAALNRRGEVAFHFAEMLMVIHGKAEPHWDEKVRPFLLRFNTDDGAERRRAFAELLEKIGQQESN